MIQMGSLVDPLNYCSTHGAGELTTYSSLSRGVPTVRTYCRACRRARARERGIVRFGRKDSPNTCQRGHLKTKRSWRRYGFNYRCLTCQYEGDKRRARDRRSTAA